MKSETKGKILLIDDDRDLGESFHDILVAKGYTVTYEDEADCALDMIEDQDFDAVVTDLEMPLVDGMDILERARKVKPRLPIIMMTGHNSTERAIAATKLGAFDYLMKPVEIPDLLDIVEKAVGSGRLTARTISIGEDEGDPKSDTIIGTSKAMFKVFKAVGTVAAKPVPVLIQGETGTGKELIARAIFQNSDRFEKPFVAVNCAAIPETTIESELFGHERGAFSNAINQRIGRFEQADGGTLFLDEIGDLPLDTQGKLLRVLQEKKICRVGGRKELEIDVRIISATHQNLAELVAEGKFRDDLFYRINSITIDLPPLSKRREDIPDLVNYFLKRAALDFDMVEPSIHKNAIKLLEGEVWPGNVRQLANVVREALLKSGGRTISPDVVKDLLEGSSISSTPNMGTPDQPSDGFSSHIYSKLLAASKDQLEGRGAFETLVEEVERELYKQAVTLSHGNQSNIAKWLGVSRLTVREKLDKFELFPKRNSSSKKSK